MSQRLKIILAASVLALIAIAAAVYFLRPAPKVEKPKTVKKGIRRVFKPTDKSLKFPFAIFSAFRTVTKGGEMQPGAYGRKDGKSDKEMLALQFYLPEDYKGTKLTQQMVATGMANSRPKDTDLDWNFQAPETGGKRQQFFLALTSVDESSGEGRLQIIIVGEMKKAIYSLTYTKIFEAKKGKVRGEMKKWLIKNIETYGPELGLIDPHLKWLDVVRKKKSK